MVDNICFRYCIECLLVFREGTNFIAEVADIDVDIPQESADPPSSYDRYFIWIHFGKKSSVTTLTKGSGCLPICLKISVSLCQRIVYLTSGIWLSL